MAADVDSLLADLLGDSDEEPEVAAETTKTFVSDTPSSPLQYAAAESLDTNTAVVRLEGDLLAGTSAEASGGDSVDVDAGHTAADGPSTATTGRDEHRDRSPAAATPSQIASENTAAVPYAISGGQTPPTTTPAAGLSAGQPGSETQQHLAGIISDRNIISDYGHSPQDTDAHGCNKGLHHPLYSGA